jgi:hypothetical protein
MVITRAIIFGINPSWSHSRPTSVELTAMVRKDWDYLEFVEIVSAADKKHMGAWSRKKCPTDMHPSSHILIPKQKKTPRNHWFQAEIYPIFIQNLHV